MITLSRLRNAQVNSRLARVLLSWYYQSGSVYTIPLGALRGCKLRYQPAINYHAMLGWWELENLRFLKNALLAGGLVPKTAVVCAVGPNIGLYSLWLARHCVPQGRVIAFEAAPD